MFTIGIIAATLAAVAYGLSTVLRAMGARNAAAPSDAAAITTEGGPSLKSTVDTFRDPTFLIGTVMVVLGFGGGAIAARLLPLFLAQTIVAGNLIVTALLGSALLGNKLSGREIAAMAAVIVSLCMLGASASHEAATKHDMAFHWALFGISTAVAVIGVVVVRSLGRRGAIFAGALSGAMYGALAVAVRVLDGVHPVDFVTMLEDPAAWTIALTGAIAFYVQTVGRPPTRTGQRRHRGARRRGGRYPGRRRRAVPRGPCDRRPGLARIRRFRRGDRRRIRRRVVDGGVRLR